MGMDLEEEEDEMQTQFTEKTGEMVVKVNDPN